MLNSCAYEQQQITTVQLYSHQQLNVVNRRHKNIFNVTASHLMKHGTDTRYVPDFSRQYHWLNSQEYQGKRMGYISSPLEKGILMPRGVSSERSVEGN